MKILPEYTFEKTSHLAPTEVIGQLKRNSEPSWDRLRYLKSGKIFAGQVLENRFKLILIDPIRPKNRPLISGHVSAVDRGSRIKIKVGYKTDQAIFFLSAFFLLIFFIMRSLISNQAVAASVTVLVSIGILVLLRLDFDRECHEIEEVFDKSL